MESIVNNLSSALSNDLDSCKRYSGFDKDPLFLFFITRNLFWTTAEERIVDVFNLTFKES